MNWFKRLFTREPDPLIELLKLQRQINLDLLQLILATETLLVETLVEEEDR